MFPDAAEAALAVLCARLKGLSLDGAVVRNGRRARPTGRRLYRRGG